jgi:ribosomal protein S18 acetylase RimI-like enzyme
MRRNRDESEKTGLIIRPATEADAALLAEMGARTFRDSYAHLNRPQDIENYIAANFSPAQIEKELRDPAATFLLATEARTIVGYIKLRDGQKPDSVSGPAPVELERIYVERETIGKGYGSALMAACLEVARQAGFETVWLGVWEKNQRAIRFYKKWGFLVVGRQTFILGDAVQSDFVMARPIEAPAA